MVMMGTMILLTKSNTDYYQLHGPPLQKRVDNVWLFLLTLTTHLSTFVYTLSTFVTKGSANGIGYHHSGGHNPYIKWHHQHVQYTLQKKRYPL